jgi:hypothetical protein
MRNAILAGLLVLAMLLFLGFHLAAPDFSDLFELFGEDLPALTAGIHSSLPLVWLGFRIAWGLQVALAVIAMVLKNKLAYHFALAAGSINVLLGLACWFTLYLPILQMSGQL